MILMFYIATYFPYRTCFYDETTPVMAFVDTIIDIFFIVDIVLNFFTVVQASGSTKFIVSHKLIAKKYMKSWFFIDLFTSIPWQLA
jgi:hypothetical protein